MPPAPLALILDRLRADDLDGAIDAGLMGVDPGCMDDVDARATVSEARQRLSVAWAARERHQARALRLERANRERAARRRPSPGATDASASAGLPPAAARALQRALAKAAGKP